MTGSLEADTIHLFQADLDRPPVPLQELRRLLSDEESARIARFRFERLQRHHTVATGLLRLLLGQITAISPRALEFQRTAHGKPYLEGGPSFNLSHSGSRLLIGVAQAGRVGVDIEVHRELTDLDRLTERTFSTPEARAILGRPPEERPPAFFRVWTRKEALIKAVGLGLGMPLRAFSVSSAELAGSEAANALLNIEDPVRFARAVADATGQAPPEESTWWIRAISVEGDALAFDLSRDSAAAATSPRTPSAPAPVEAAVAWDRDRPPRLVRLQLLGGS